MPLCEKPVYIHEPTPLQCGQAVSAIFQGKSGEEIIKIVGTEREDRQQNDVFRTG